MRFKRHQYIIIICLVSFLFICCFKSWRVQEQLYHAYYYITLPDKPITNKAELTELLSSFKRIEYKDLKADYKNYTKSELPGYKELLDSKSYYTIKRKDFYKRIAGSFRIKDLIAKDKFYKSCIKNGSEEYMWLISEELLLKLFDLRMALEEAGNDPNAFSITNAHRHPKYNEDVGGASKSRHIQGQALDLYIGDINKSGSYEKEDKQIVLDLLEDQIIGDHGGIGRYPDTRAVHFDVRGHRARWDRY